jgi:two-component system cell cycle sensor histidine kinase/response regulator CckA
LADVNHVPGSTGAHPAPESAVLVLGAEGRIQLAGAAAGALWGVAPGALAGELLPALFESDATTRDPDWLRSQWEKLAAAAVGPPLPLRLRARDGAGRDVTLRLEQVSTAPEQWRACIRPAAPAAAPAASPPAAAPAGLLAHLGERGPLGLFDLNFLRREAYYSPAWKRMLGYADDALPNTYETWLKLIHPDDSAAAPDRQGRAGAAGARPFAHEFRMKHAHGHYVWVQCVGLQHYGPNGALQRVTGAQLDIGDRKEFEEAGLRASERLAELGERGRAGFFDLDFAGGVYWLSPGFKALLGYTDSDLPDTIESVLRSLPIEETAGGLPAYFLAQHPGQISYYDVIYLRHREERDVPVYAGIVRQISRRKELQRVLGFVVPLAGPFAASRPGHEGGLAPDHVAALLAELQEGVLLADAASRVAHLNPKAERLLGRTLAQALGQDTGELLRLVHRVSRQPGENPVTKTMATGEAIALNTEFALETDAGAPRPVAFSARPVVDASGRPSGAVVVFRDPAEMSLTPEELVRANRFDALGQLAGGIAHDFNNLLTTILGGVSLAKDNRDYSGLENSERACLAAKSLSKQLLTYAKGGTATRQVVRPADLLADAARLAAAGSAVKVDISADPETGSICVDRAQMLQVFQNLIINAIQAMTTGQGNVWLKASPVTLAAGEVPPLAAGAYVAIEVRDNGSGIPPQHLERVFEPFFTTKKSGTGLGLSTVLSIVRRHGGQMGVESELGTGTAFTVFLPPSAAPGEVEARRAPSFNQATRTGRVLFMDDDLHICAIAGTMLESLGYRYDVAHTGEEAVQLYKRYLNIGRPYDVVIMDLTIIGGMGGEQTFRLLRDLHADVRAIIASGYDNEDMARQFLDLGFLGYLTKPYRVGDLGRILRKVLGS